MLVTQEVSVSIYITDVTLVSEDTYEQDEKDDVDTVENVSASKKDTKRQFPPSSGNWPIYSTHTNIRYKHEDTDKGELVETGVSKITGISWRSTGVATP